MANIYQYINPHKQDPIFWLKTIQHYSKLLTNHPQFELAETFYNAVIGRVFKHSKIEDSMMFVLASNCYLSGQDRDKIIHSFDTSSTVRGVFEEIFQTYQFNVPFADSSLDLANMDDSLRKRLNAEQLTSIRAIELLKPVFYRGKAAYLVSRICLPKANLPFVIILQITDKKTIFVDALRTHRTHVGVIFRFARSYFMANTQYPAEVVAYLQKLLTNKKDFERYVPLGFYKHGKTVFYRSFLSHLTSTGLNDAASAHDQFKLAPGINGLVMTVFPLPSYGVVFKIIKDEFSESKSISRKQVKECYQLVKTTDRLGRMANTHEYVNFRFPKNRFTRSYWPIYTKRARLALSKHLLRLLFSICT